MVTRAEADRLLQFHSDEYLITSCYLDLDRAKRVPPVLKIRAKGLLQSAQKELSGKAAGHAQRESLRDDFVRIEEFVLQEIETNHRKGLAVFSCSAQKFWQTYALPRIGRNILIADLSPYIRPLVAG